MLKITSYFDQEQSIEMHKRVKDKSVENVSGKQHVSNGNTNTRPFPDFDLDKSRLTKEDYHMLKVNADGWQKKDKNKKSW